MSESSILNDSRFAIESALDSCLELLEKAETREQHLSEILSLAKEHHDTLKGIQRNNEWFWTLLNDKRDALALLCFLLIPAAFSAKAGTWQQILMVTASCASTWSATLFWLQRKLKKHDASNKWSVGNSLKNSTDSVTHFETIFSTAKSERIQLEQQVSDNRKHLAKHTREAEDCALGEDAAKERWRAEIQCTRWRNKRAQGDYNAEIMVIRASDLLLKVTIQQALKVGPASRGEFFKKRWQDGWNEILSLSRDVEEGNSQRIDYCLKLPSNLERMDSFAQERLTAGSQEDISLIDEQEKAFFKKHEQEETEIAHKSDNAEKKFKEMIEGLKRQLHVEE
jgi:hypothetical protein